MPSPSPGRTPGVNILAAVAATSTSNAWAVGYYSFLGPDSTLTLIENWNGHAWRQVPSPNPARGSRGGPPVANASAASQPSPAPTHGPLVSTPPPASKARRSSCTGTATPGSMGKPRNPAIAASSPPWPPPPPATSGSWQLLRRTRRPDLIEHSNGHAWTRVPSPDPAGFWHHKTGVTAVSAGDAWAVGRYSYHGLIRTLILH